MVGATAEHDNRAEGDDLVIRARCDTDALARLYELYYDRIFRFCLHRLFYKEVAEDVTSTVFLEVARRIRTFSGRSEKDFSNWIYAIAANQTNAYIRKTSRRQRLLKQRASSIAAPSNDDSTEPDWPSLYDAIMKLKPKYQTIITLRFFENLEFEEIAKIVDARPATVRGTLHRILARLRDHLQAACGGPKDD